MLEFITIFVIVTAINIYLKGMHWLRSLVHPSLSAIQLEIMQKTAFLALFYCLLEWLFDEICKNNAMKFL